MKRLFSALLAIAIVSLTLWGCGGGGKSTPEATLAVTLTPAVGSTQAPAPGPNFPLNVKITSAIPAKGVTINVSAAPDGSASAFFTASPNSSQASNDFSITNTPVAQVCVLTVTVTSLSTATNTWTGSYRYSAK
ncbi:MAG TPA: hypothetical protein VE035_15680 [Puia sp.]|nr:hypothetical protein [Puia sp.]